MKTNLEKCLEVIGENEPRCLHFIKYKQCECFACGDAVAINKRLEEQRKRAKRFFNNTNL